MIFCYKEGWHLNLSRTILVFFIFRAYTLIICVIHIRYVKYMNKCPLARAQTDKCQSDIRQRSIHFLRRRRFIFNISIYTATRIKVCFIKAHVWCKIYNNMTCFSPITSCYHGNNIIYRNWRFYILL